MWNDDAPSTMGQKNQEYILGAKLHYEVFGYSEVCKASIWAQIHIIWDNFQLGSKCSLKNFQKTVMAGRLFASDWPFKIQT